MGSAVGRGRTGRLVLQKVVKIGPRRQKLLAALHIGASRAASLQLTVSSIADPGKGPRFDNGRQLGRRYGRYRVRGASRRPWRVSWARRMVISLSLQNWRCSSCCSREVEKCHKAQALTTHKFPRKSLKSCTKNTISFQSIITLIFRAVSSPIRVKCRLMPKLEALPRRYQRPTAIRCLGTSAFIGSEKRV